MKINRKLDDLLFDREKEKANPNFLYDTQSIYDSLDIQQENAPKTMEYYVIPYNKEKNSVNFQEKISDLTIKEKFQKISTSLKSFNFVLKPATTKTSFEHLNSSGIDNLLKNKNFLINFLLDFIIDLIWKIKEENLQKDTFIDKINFLNSQKEELEKKLKKMNSEIADSKKEVTRMSSSVILRKEKLDKKKIKQETELTEIKLENKKLNAMLQNFKNEIKKREMDFTRIQEKIKKLLHSPLPKNQFFELGDSNTNGENEFKVKENDFHKSASKIIYQNFINEFNNQKYELTLNQNYYLMNILKHLQTSFENLMRLSAEIRKNFSSNSFSTDENVLETLGSLRNLDFNSLKENIFSVHLLETNLLEEFYEKFLKNFNKYEEFVLKLLDFRMNRKAKNLQKKNQTMKSLNNSVLLKVDDSVGDDKDILKNFKKWSNNNRSVRYQSKWLDNLDKSKDVNFYDESKLIKLESDEDVNDTK